MNQLIVLCDKNWIIAKKLYDTSDYGMQVGDCLKDFVLNSDKLEREDDLQAQKQNLVILKFFGNKQSLPTVIHSYEDYFLVCVADITSRSDYEQFVSACINAYSWADDNIQKPYTDEYSQLELINNRLLNSERALMKKNAQLKRTLAQVTQANDAIAILERDAWTDLYSTSGFYRHVGLLLKQNKATTYDMIILDIDGFRLVNELFGRREGLRFLQQLALVLTAMQGAEQGVLARVYAGTFYIFMPSGLQFYVELRKKLEEFLPSYPLPLTLQSRMGVYGGVDISVPVVEICNRARLALDYNLVHNEEENEIFFYNNELHNKLLLEHQLLDRIPEALKNGELKMYLQSKVDMRTGKVIGAEALVRWINPELGFIPPDKFIPLLEKEGLIYEVDKCIWEQACQVLQERKAHGLSLLPISVNVARNDLYEKSLVQDLQELVGRYGLQPENLRLEILERDYVSNSRKSFEVLAQLRSLGFWIEMDDFGIEASSLAMLADMPFDILKLDRHFLLSALNNERQIEVMRFIINLGHSLKMRIIAEGVETKEQEELLLSLGCIYAQGYLYCKPQPAEFFLELE